MRVNNIHSDLQLIPPPHFEPFKRFVIHGVYPHDDPGLLRELCGDHSAAHGDGALMIVRAFLEMHDSVLDIAHGHLGYVLRWQAIGGMAGRA